MKIRIPSENSSRYISRQKISGHNAPICTTLLGRLNHAAQAIPPSTIVLQEPSSTVNTEIFIGTNKPMKICTDKKLATVITVGYPHPQKFLPVKILSTKYCNHEDFCVNGMFTECPGSKESEYSSTAQQTAEVLKELQWWQQHLYQLERVGPTDTKPKSGDRDKCLKHRLSALCQGIKTGGHCNSSNAH